MLDKNTIGKRQRGRGGMTLVELAVAMTVMTVLMTMLMMVFRKSVDVYKTVGLQGHLQDQVRAALEIVSNDVREAIGFNPVNPGEWLFDVFEPTPGEFVAGNDTNGNGIWDVGELYQDANGNGLYDGPHDILLLSSARGRIEEPFTDSNGNGFYDVGEPFEDLNANFEWDEANANGQYEPAFRTISAPANLAGEPDAHSLIVYAICQNADGIAQLVKYTLYRVEIDTDGDGWFENTDDDDDGFYEQLEDFAEGTSVPWNPPYTVVATTTTTITLEDDADNPVVILKSNGDINGNPPLKSPVVLANDVNSFDVSLGIMPGNTILAHMQVGMRRNVASYNPNALQKGRVFASLTASACMMN
jgi:type II secretory pathway pseudopilin PulG